MIKEVVPTACCGRMFSQQNRWSWPIEQGWVRECLAALILMVAAAVASGAATNRNCPLSNETVVLDRSANTVIWSYCTDYSTDSVVTIDIREADGITVVVEHSRRIAVFVRLSTATAFRNIRLAFTNVTFAIASSRWGYSGATQGLFSLYSVEGPCDVSDVSIIFNDVNALLVTDDSDFAVVSTEGLLRSVVSLGTSIHALSLANFSFEVHSSSFLNFSTVVYGNAVTVTNMSLVLSQCSLALVAREAGFSTLCVSGILLHLQESPSVSMLNILVMQTTISGSIALVDATGANEQGGVNRVFAVVSVLHSVYVGQRLDGLRLLCEASNFTVNGSGYTYPVFGNVSRFAVLKPLAAVLAVADNGVENYDDIRHTVSDVTVKLVGCNVLAIGKRQSSVLMFQMLAVINCRMSLIKSRADIRSMVEPWSPPPSQASAQAVVVNGVLANSSIEISDCLLLITGKPGTVAGYSNTNEFAESLRFLDVYSLNVKGGPGTLYSGVHASRAAYCSFTLLRSTFRAVLTNGTLFNPLDSFSVVVAAVSLVGEVTDRSLLPALVDGDERILRFVRPDGRCFVTLSDCVVDVLVGVDVAGEGFLSVLPYGSLLLTVGALVLGNNQLGSNTTNLVVGMDSLEYSIRWDTQSPLPQANGHLRVAALVAQYDASNMIGAFLAPFIGKPFALMLVQSRLSSLGVGDPATAVACSFLLTNVVVNIDLYSDVSTGYLSAKYGAVGGIFLLPTIMTNTTFFIVNITSTSTKSVSLFIFGSFNTTFSFRSCAFGVTGSVLNALTFCTLPNETCAALLTETELTLSETNFTEAPVVSDPNSYSKSLSSALLIGEGSLVTFSRCRVTGWETLLWSSPKWPVEQSGVVVIDCGNRWRADPTAVDLMSFPHAMVTSASRLLRDNVKYMCTVTQPMPPALQVVSRHFAGASYVATAAISAALFSAMTNSLGGMMFSMQLVVQNSRLSSRCNALKSDAAGSNDPLPFSDFIDNPFHIHIECCGDENSFALGCVVGCVLQFFVIALGANVLKLVSTQVGEPRDSLSGAFMKHLACVLDSMPGCLYFPFVFSSQPLVASAIFLIATKSTVGVITGIIVILATVFVVSTLALRVVVRRNATIKCVAVPPGRLPRNHFFRSLFDQWEWCAGTNQDAIEYFQRYGDVFSGYRENRIWYFMVELLSSLASSVISGVATAIPAKAFCDGPMSLVAVALQSAVLGFVLIACATLRPQIAALDCVSVVTQTSMSLVSLWLSTSEAYSSTVDVLLLTQTILSLVSLPLLKLGGIQKIWLFTNNKGHNSTGPQTTVRRTIAFQPKKVPSEMRNPLTDLANMSLRPAACWYSRECALQLLITECCKSRQQTNTSDRNEKVE